MTRRGFVGRGVRPGGRMSNGAALLGGALVLLGWGAWEAYSLARLFHGGVEATGIIVRVDD